VHDRRISIAVLQQADCMGGWNLVHVSYDEQVPVLQACISEIFAQILEEKIAD